MRCLSSSVLLLLAAGCGYTDSGSGSNTLEVIATVEYRADDNSTRAEITVNKSGAKVEGAQVVLTDGDSGDEFAIAQQNNGNNTVYRNEISGYHRKMALKVASGSDELTGQLEGPGPHIISNPDNSEILDRNSMGDTFEVRWTTEDGIRADEITIRFNQGDFETTISNDNGKYSVPTTKLNAQNDEVRVTRRNRTKLSGGILASSLEISYRVENSVIVQN
ncbi:MAG: hypothetical protein HY903_14425 [Deltaproteobacteria bacterium]|nr:hypothetical protein [Deltaproteobacteria bacterium]